MRCIEAGRLWIGSAADVRQIATLAEEGIEAVVQLAYEEPVATLPRELLLWRVPLHDGAGNPPERLRLAVTAIELLLQARIPTLVACSGGMSRSPAIAAVALARVQDGGAMEFLERLRL